MSSPPLWAVFAVQAVSVAGDQLGQRALRHDFSGSSRRMLMALTVISCLQVTLFLGGMELFVSSDVTGAIYANQNKTHVKVDCFKEVDCEGHFPSYCDSHQCSEIECPAQGPGSIWKSIGLHPLLLLNGVLNIAYYVGEVLLYQHALGLILIVIASLAASFIIQPLEGLVGLTDSGNIPTIVIILGIFGSLFCVLEKRISGSKNLRTIWNNFCTKFSKCCGKSSLVENASSENTIPFYEESTIKQNPVETKEGNSYKYEQILDTEEVEKNSPSDFTSIGQISILQQIRESMWVMIPFITLAITYGCWFVTQKLFNDKYRVNVFGYTSLDQGLTPFYMIPFLFIVDRFQATKRTCVPENEHQQSFFEALKSAYSQLFVNKGSGLATVFFYRLLINARAMAYFYLSVAYDLSTVYLELTLVRIVLSWVAAVCVCAVCPKYIRLTEGERNTVFHPWNLFLKVIGTILIIIALLILNANQ